VARLGDVCSRASVSGIDLFTPVGVSGPARDLAGATATRAAIAHVSPDVVVQCAGGVVGRDLDKLTTRLVVWTRILLEVVSLEAAAAVFVVPSSAAEYGTLHALGSDDESWSRAAYSPYLERYVRSHDAPPDKTTWEIVAESLQEEGYLWSPAR
jgi:hypothetical protein